MARLTYNAIMDRYLPVVYDLIMQGYETPEDIKHKHPEIKNDLPDEDIIMVVDRIKQAFEPITRKERERLRAELIAQASFMRRKIYAAIESADNKTGTQKELFNTLIKLNEHTARLAGITATGKGDSGDIFITQNNTENKQVNINVENWSKDDLEKAKKIRELQKQLNCVPKTNKTKTIEADIIDG